MNTEKQKGIIYAITCNITGQVYYGSTFKTLNQRMSGHKCKSNRAISKQIIERGDYTEEVIIEGLFRDADELRNMEAYFIKNYECINKNIPCFSKEELVKLESIINDLVDLSRFRKKEIEIKDKEIEILNKQYELEKLKFENLLKEREVERSNGKKYLCSCGEVVTVKNKTHINSKFHKMNK